MSTAGSGVRSTRPVEVAEVPGVLVETATWPSPRVVDVDGWCVGLSGGVTRRAGSAIALVDVPDLTAAVDRVEALYRADGAAPVFRVGDPGNPAGLLAELDARGYVERGVTDVLVRQLGTSPGASRDTPPHRADTTGAPAGGGVRVLVAEQPDDTWLDVWLAGRGTVRETSRAIVTGAPALYLTAAAPDGSVHGVLRAAPVDDWVALSCLQVEPTARRRGIGRVLTQEALAAAAAAGAKRAFLQVEAGNVAARGLYCGLGFVPAHRYAYRELPEPGASGGR